MVYGSLWYTCLKLSGVNYKVYFLEHLRKRDQESYEKG